MPVLFQGKCGNRGHKTHHFSNAGVAFRGDGWSVEPLPHPCEASRLAQLGHTFESAGKGGRLVALESLVCGTCGGIYERRTLLTGLESGGCLPALGLALGVGIGLGIASWRWARPNFVLAVMGGWWIGGYSAVLLHEIFVIKPAARRLKTPAPPVEDLPCCGSPVLIPVGKAARSRFPCRQCGRSTVDFRSVGIS